MIVKEIRNNEGGIIRIHDDSLKSKEEQELIIKRMTESIQRSLIAKMLANEKTA